MSNIAKRGMPLDFQDSVRFLDNQYVNNDHPDNFGNSVHYSSGSTPRDYNGFSYLSNFSLKVMLEGWQKTMVNDQRVLLTQKKCLLVNNSTETVFMAEAGKALTIYLDPLIMEDVYLTMKNEKLKLDSPFELSNDSLSFYPHPYRETPRIVNHLVEYISNECTPQLTSDFYYEVAEQLIHRHHQLDSIVEKAPSTQKSTKQELFRRSEVAKDFILSNLREPFSLDRLSKECSLSKYHLLRTFRNFYNITPHQFYIREKVKDLRECYLNNEEKTSLSEMCYLYGYPDYASFSKQFKSVLGYPPSQTKLYS